MLDRVLQRPFWRLELNNRWVEAAAVCILVFAACMVGIQSRLLFSLASVWPANALFLGWLLLRPSANQPVVWLGGIVGYVLADLSAGSGPLEIIMLNGANLVGIAAGFAVARLFGRVPLGLRSPEDVVMTIIIIATASIATALMGGLTGPLLFDMHAGSAFGLWLAAEFVNHGIYLPILLAAGSGSLRIFSRNGELRLHQIAALCCLMALILSMSGIGGPGAPAYVVPGLLWCGIVFRPFASALLTAATCTWILIGGPLGLFSLQYELATPADATSFRLSIGMIAIGAFAVSAINGAWRKINADLRHVASHDGLTGLLNRGAVMDRLSTRLATGKKPFSLLILDIDRFKAINDTYGHPIGDRALEMLSATIRSRLGSSDFAGRIGGEEFIILTEGNLAEGGMALAERLRQEAASLSLTTPSGEVIGLTISIGVAEARAGDDMSLLLSATDSALYMAKDNGRNRVVPAIKTAAAY